MSTALRSGVGALALPFILPGGIYSGYFSPTEAAAVFRGYALLFELFVQCEGFLCPRLANRSGAAYAFFCGCGGYVDQSNSDD